MSENLIDKIPLIDYLHKIDSTANWDQILENSKQLSSEFIPKKGEIVLYQDNINTSIKIGDGITSLKDLPYFGSSTLRQGMVPSALGLNIENKEEDEDSLCVTGCKGYKITKINSIELFTIEGPLSGEWKVGDRIAFDIDKTFTYYKIKQVNSKEVKFTPTIPPEYVKEVNENDNFLIWNLDKPEFGKIDIGIATLSQGLNTAAIGKASVALNRATRAEGNFSFAANRDTRAGYGAAAFGKATEARGTHSFTTGQGTVAEGSYQIVEGKFNIKDTEDKYAHIVGNGKKDSERKNIQTLDWEGTAWVLNDLKIGGTDQDSSDISVKNLDLQVATNINDISELQTEVEQTKENLEQLKNDVHDAVFAQKITLHLEYKGGGTDKFDLMYTQ